MPTLEPSCTGLIMTGKPNSAMTESRSVSLVIMRYGAVGKSLPCQICLVLTLSMPIAEPCTPVPV